MKRLTWALWSLMLFLGLGTAFAEDEDRSVPKLTLSTENITIQAGGSAVFSCTMDPQDYTNSKNKVCFAIKGLRFAGVESLEYQVGGDVNAEGWLAYDGDNMEALIDDDEDTFGPAIPANSDGNSNPRVCNIETGTRTVHYRLTLKAEASEMPEIRFVASAPTPAGFWSEMNAAEPLATATVTFTLGTAPQPVVAPTAPTFDPDGGEVVKGSKITLTNGYESDATPKKIYYNFGSKTAADLTNIKTEAELKAAGRNGLLIQNAANEYKAPITINGASTYNAATADIDADGNVTWSDVITKSFTIKVVEPTKPAAPTFNPDGGEVEAGTEVTLSMAAADEMDCSIFYIIDGNDEDFDIATMKELYTESDLVDYEEEGLTITADVTVKAAVARFNEDESITWSDIETKTFTVTGGGEPSITVARPVITPGNDPGTAKIGQMVTITCETNGATIYYTTDKSEPTAESTAYTEAFAITEAMMIMQENVPTPNGIVTVRAVAMKDGVKSELNHGAWEIVPDALEFAPEAGEVAKGTTVTLSCVPAAAKIYYTTDGTTPTEESTLYAEAIEISEDITIKAFAVLGQRESSVATAAYTVKGDTPGPVEPETVAAPTFNPAAGAVVKGTKVELACETEGAVIYYTVNGTEPTEKSTGYKEAIEINEAMTIKAIAIKGDAKSEVAEAAYTIDRTANEGEEELSGVTVYPNPSNGLFHMELPCAATVEVFMSNGMLYQRVNAAAGNATLNIERSGIYFLRITGEGRAVIKRVIVR